MEVEMEVDLNVKVAQAVHVLNHDSLSSNRLAANQWLVHFQKSKDAWEVAIAILTSQNAMIAPDFELAFFASQILKRKVKNEGHCLPLPAKDALFNILILAAKRFTLGPPQLLTQICLALSALVLREVECKKPMEQLFSSLEKLQSEENGIIAVFEMLTVFPEEVIEDQISDQGSVGCTSSSQFARELVAHTPMVLGFLLLQSEIRLGDEDRSQERNRKILRCLLSWVRVGCFSEIPPSTFQAHPLLNFVFNTLHASLTFDIAIEVLIELVSRYEVLPQVLLFRIRYLKEAILTPALNNRDENVIRGLACFMSEIGEAAPALIAEGSKEALVLTEALIRCVAFPSEDWEISDSILPFWCSLARYLLSLHYGKTNDRKNVGNTFITVFSSLLDALLIQIQVKIPGFSDEIGSHAIPDGLFRFRLNLEELLIDICQLLGSAIFIQKVFGGGWATTDVSISWAEIEGRMCALNLVADAVMQDGLSFDFSVIMHMVTILSSITPDKLNGFMCLVYKSVADVVGSYSKWICTSENNLKMLILFCASGIKESVSTACSTTLRKLCEDGSSFIQEGSNLEILILIGENLDKNNLALEEEEEVVAAIMVILGSVSDKRLKNNSLTRLLSSSYAAIEKLTDADKEISLRENPAAYMQFLNAAVKGLYRKGTVFSHLRASHSTVLDDDATIPVLLNVFWPLLEKLFRSVHMESRSLTAAACKALSQVVKSSGQHFLMMLPRVLDCLSTKFLSFQSHECYVRTAAVVIEEFGHREEYGALFINTFDRFTSSASITALTSSSYICDQVPDLVEAYTNFTTTYMLCCPEEVLVASGSLLELSLQKAAICCTAMHRGVALSAMSYMSCFLEVTIRSLLESETCFSEVSFSAIAIQVLSHSGEGLISNIIYALLGASALSRVHKSATILQQIAAICQICDQTRWKTAISWDSLFHWLQTTVHSLPAEHLKQREVKFLVPIWKETLTTAASDYLASRGHDSVRNGNWRLQGRGGRTLKKVIRNFADSHHNILSTT